MPGGKRLRERERTNKTLSAKQHREQRQNSTQTKSHMILRNRETLSVSYDIKKFTSLVESRTEVSLPSVPQKDDNFIIFPNTKEDGTTDDRENVKHAPLTVDITSNNGLLSSISSNPSHTSGMSFNSLCNQATQKPRQNQINHENIPPDDLEKKDDRILLSVIESATEDRVLELLKGHTFSQDGLDKALITACRRGLKYLVQTLVHLKVNVNYQDTNGNTPLLICVENGYIGLVCILISSKADINAVNSAGDSALILSICSSGSEEMVKVLLEQKKININHQNQAGYTALMKAIEVKDIHTISILLARLYDDNMKGPSDVPEHHFEWNFLDYNVNHNGQTAPEIAKLSGLGSIFEILKDSIKTRVSPLLLALEKSDTESFNTLLHHQFCDKDYMKISVSVAFVSIFEKCHEKKCITLSETEMIEGLLECGADVNKSCSDSPLFVAVVTGSYYVVELLCKHGAKLNDKLTKYGPLEIAAKNGRCDILELLLRYNADTNRNLFVGSALDYALKNGHIDCARLLIKHGAILDMTYALHSAVTHQVLSSLTFLLQSYQHSTLESKKTLQHLLMRAVELGYLDIIGLILDAGADINQPVNNQRTPLVESKNGEVAQYLIQRGADVNQIIECGENGSTTTMLQILRTRAGFYDSTTTEIIQVLLENGAFVNARSGDCKMTLILAASKGDVNLLQLLLDHGADLSDKDEEGNTALIESALDSSFQNVSFLLQYTKTKDVLNAQNNKGLTALMCAVSSDSISAVQNLVNHGADVNIKDVNGNTALLHAVIELSKAETVNYNLHETGIMKVLISAGSDVNCQNHDGFSPLMLAAWACLKEAVQLLLESGAEVNTVSRNDHTRTALTCVMDSIFLKKKAQSCIESLLENGASSSYVKPFDLQNVIMCYDLEDMIPKLIRCGLGPGYIMPQEFQWDTYILLQLKLSSISPLCITLLKGYISPLCMALLNEYVGLAHYFMKTLFLTNSDVFSLTHNKNLRRILKRMKLYASVRFLNEITSQPLSLFNLSFVAVSSAVGASPGRENRVSLLPLPEIIKDRLLFRSKDVVNMGSEINNISTFNDDSGSDISSDNLSDSPEHDDSDTS